MNHQRRRERPALRRVAARERGAARKGEEIKKFVRASAELVKTEGAGISIWYWNISATRWLSK